jgi:hypothetical protein
MLGRLMKWIYRTFFGITSKANPADELEKLEAERETLQAAYQGINQALIINRKRIDTLIDRQIEDLELSL